MQIFAAPRAGIFQDGDFGQAPISSDAIIEPAREIFPSEQQNKITPEPNFENLEASLTAPAAEDGISTPSLADPIQATVDNSEQQMREQVGENFGNLESVGDQVGSAADIGPSVNPEITRGAENPHEHFSHMLTREQELKLLHEVPEFTEIIQAMERLPDDIYMEMKNFLASTVPRMPENNLFTRHFENADVLVQIFERLIKAARTGAIHQPTNKELFNRVHQAAPEMKNEMDTFDGFIGGMKSRLASLGTSINPMNSMTQPPTAGINVAAGSVSLPVVEEKMDNFANEFTPAENSTE